MGLDIIGARR